LDFDRDGRPDIAVVASDAVVILYQQRR